ncbi:MAG: HAMP domain-containing histidine kinase [Methylocystaceae bacterium]|nr:HAMP domain-containing histidine kinase [Methylocystaceae bacterium]
MKWRAETHKTLIDHAFHGSIPITVFSSCAAILLALMLGQSLNDITLFGWILFFFATQALRLAITAHYRRNKNALTLKDGYKWLYLAVLPSSFAWGILPVLSFSDIGAMDRVIITVFLSTAPTAQLTSIGNVFRVWVASMLFLMVPLSGTWLFLEHHGAIMGLIGFLFIIYLYNIAKTYHVLLGDKIELHSQAHATSQAKSTFLATASHDLRQPLHAITMSLAAALARLKQKEPSQAEIQASVKSIEAADNSVENLSQLLNALLDMSKIEAGSLKPSFARIPISTLFSQLKENYKPLAQEKNIDLRIVPSSLHIHSDPVFLLRIIGNLVSNAVRHLNQGRILVGCKRKGDTVIIQVIDDGPGIAPEKFRDIFAQFNQLENKGRHPSGGYGLGLSIADGLARALGLTLSVNSVVGQGSAFYLDVPISEVSSAEQHQTPKEQKSPTKRETHLVVLLQPDSHILDETAIQIRDWGYRVLAFQSLEEAQSLKVRPHLLITAQSFPSGLSGLEVSNILCGVWKTQAPTLLMISDFSPKKIMEASQASAKLIPSPPDPKEFRQTIHDMIAKS